MAKVETYCVTDAGQLASPKGGHHYTVYKMDPDEPPEMATIYDVVLKGELRSCNCPGFTYHSSPAARGPQHKHFRLVQFYKDNYDPVVDGSVLSLFINLHRNGDMTKGTNPFSDVGLEDNCGI